MFTAKNRVGTPLSLWSKNKGGYTFLFMVRKIICSTYYEAYMTFLYDETLKLGPRMLQLCLTKMPLIFLNLGKRVWDQTLSQSFRLDDTPD